MRSPFRLTAMISLGLLLGLASSAEAVIVITPSTQVNWFFSGSGNVGADDLETFFNGSGDVPPYNLGGDELSSAYKSDVQQTGGPIEAGPFASSYTTVFSNTPNDPEDANITWDGPGVISREHMFLVVKDGNQGTYVFNLNSIDTNGDNVGDTFWDGKEELDLNDFWLGQGAISHVEIIGGGDEIDRGPLLPEPASIVAWLLGAGGLGLILRRRASKVAA